MNLNGHDVFEDEIDWDADSGTAADRALPEVPPMSEAEWAESLTVWAQADTDGQVA